MELEWGGLEEGTYTVTITATNADGSTATTTFTAIVADANLTPGTVSASGGVEGVSATILSATFTDVYTGAPTSDFSGTINWGDTTTTFNSSNVSGSGGSYTVNASHTYGDEGTYYITVTINDVGGKSTIVSGWTTVTDANLTGSSTATATGGVEDGTVAILSGATFTDASTGAPSSDFSISSVNWGDGSTNAAGLTVIGSGGSYSVAGSHLYTEEGSYNFTITVTDDGGKTATITGSATVGDASLIGSNSATGIGGVEGVTAAALSGATFTDASTGAPSTDFSISSVKWGDGSTDATGLTITGSGGNYTVLGSHLYAEEGDFNFSITVADDGGKTAVITGTATVSDANLWPGMLSPPTPTEGQAIQNAVLFHFTDGDPHGAAGDYTAVVGWGDGTTDSSASGNNVCVVVNANGGFDVLGSHTYLEEAAGLNFTVTVTDHNSQTSASGTVSVSDPQVLVTPVSSLTAEEGSNPSLLVATFTDPGGNEPNAADEPNSQISDHYSAQIQWQGSSSPTTGTITWDATNSCFDVTADHTFAEEGTETLTVTISHEQSPPKAITESVEITDPEVDATGNFTITGTEGSDNTTQTVATFTDPAGAEVPANYADGDPLPDYSATIDWGDHTTPTTGTITFDPSTQIFTVTAAHPFAEEGTTVTVTIHHDSAPDAVVTDPTSVTDPAVAATGGFTISGSEGVDTGSETVATFTDPGGPEVAANYSPGDPLPDYSATIDWGTTTSTGTITYDSYTKTFTVTGDDLYQEEHEGTVTVTIHHDGAPDAVVTDTAEITDPAVEATGDFTINATEGIQSSVQTVATFTDPGGAEVPANYAAGDPLTDYSATIDWGDASATSAGEITYDPQTDVFTVTGDHLYAEEGTQNITVTISHDDAPEVTVTDQVEVANAPLTDTTLQLTPVPVQATENGSLAGLTVATFSDQDTSEDASTFTATVDWGTGNGPQPADVTGSNGAFDISYSGADVYPQEGSYDVTIHLTADDGRDEKTYTTAVVDEPALTLNTPPQPIQATQYVPLDSTTTLATFSDPNVLEDTSAFAATVDWGDGTGTYPAVVTGSAGNFSILAGHTYQLAPSSFTAMVTLVEDGAALDPVTVPIDVQPASPLTGPLQGTGQRESGFGSQQTSGIFATFTDANPGNSPASDTAIISWGDGSKQDAGQIVDPGNGAPWEVLGSHTYVEGGNYLVTVSIADPQGDSLTVYATASIAAPALSVTAVPISVAAGVPVTNVYLGFVGDADMQESAQTLQVTVDWGDGTPSQSAGLVGSTQGYWIYGSHTYAATGTYTLKLTLHDPDNIGADVTAEEDVTVADAAEGMSPALEVGSFRDGDPLANGGDFGEVTGWGDGSLPDSGDSLTNLDPDSATQSVPASFEATDSHLWIGPGSFVDTTNVTDDPSDPATTQLQHDVTVSDISLLAGPSTTGRGIAGINSKFTVARFSDPNYLLGQDTFTAEIDWGDSTRSAGTVVSLGKGNYAVVGAHPYAGMGTYQITVLVMAAGGYEGILFGTAVISPDIVPTFSEPGELIATPSGAQGSDPMSAGFSEGGVRYIDGAVEVSAPELSSGGFGIPWGQDSTYTNMPLYSTGSFNGSGMMDSELPRLLDPAGDQSTLVLVSGGTNARYFDLQADGSYKERFFLLDTLSYDPAQHEYRFADPNGDQMFFFGFSQMLPATQQGGLIQMLDPYGNATTLTWTFDGKPMAAERSGLNNDGSTVTEEYWYTYNSHGLLQNVALWRSGGGMSWYVVRQVSYIYYGAGDANGNPGDLESATVKDGAGNPLDVYYYRYYLSGQPQGYPDQLKYFFNPQSFARLDATLSVSGTEDWLDDSEVAPYATLFLQYDSQGRVSSEAVAGAGASADGGIGTYEFSYLLSGKPAGFNSWAVRTTETLPDGSTNYVYTNSYGEVMLKVFNPVGNNVNNLSGQWKWFTGYDDQGRVVLQANPSAINGYWENAPDLMNFQNGKYTLLLDSAGLMTGFTYAGGYLSSVAIRQGQLGTWIPQKSFTYGFHSVGGVNVSPLDSSTVYRNADGTGQEITYNDYTWFGGTNMPQSVTVTSPPITFAENGFNQAAVDVTFNDTYGRPIWHKNALGFLDYTEYDQATGAIIKTITDVNMAMSGDYLNPPAGWSTPTGGGLHLVTLRTVDPLGRTTELIDPNDNITYTVYLDTQNEVRVYPGWNPGNGITGTTAGPVQVTRNDRANGYVETFSMLVANIPEVGGAPIGFEAIDNLESLSRTYYNIAGQGVETDSYFSLSGLTYSTGRMGTVNIPQTPSGNYYASFTAYDVRGRAFQTISGALTVSQTTFDALGRPIATLAGTAGTDLVVGALTQVSANVYDGGLVGDGNLTQVTQFPGGAAPNRVTVNWYDWRDRLVATKQGVQASEDITTHRPVVVYTYDNLNEKTSVLQFDGDGAMVSVDNNGQVTVDTGGPDASRFRAQTSFLYDEVGQVYQTNVFNVDTSGNYQGALVTKTHRDLNGQVIAQSNPGGLWTKTTYDGAGRPVVVYSTDGGNGTTGVTQNDIVLEQTETAYDADGNAILVTTRQRFNDETAGGPLGGPNSSDAPKARDYYVANYYDAVNRLIATDNFGTNFGLSLSRPNTPPPPRQIGTDFSSDLLTTTSYQDDGPAGWETIVTDPRGIVSKTYFDNLGRTIKTIADYTNGIPTSSSDQTTEYGYDGDNNQLFVQVDLPGGGVQKTQYVYGGNALTNDMLSEVYYPDPGTGQPSTNPNQQVGYTLNNLGQITGMTDRNGTWHVYSFDVLGRQTSDTIANFGTDVDQTVDQLATAYDTYGNPYLFTSSKDGTAVNQVRRTFNGLGQITAEYQAQHGSAQNLGISDSVSYVYNDPANANNSRLVNIRYPNGRTITYNYTGLNGIDDRISRVTSITDGTDPNYSTNVPPAISNVPLEQVSYLGLSTVASRSFNQLASTSQPFVGLSYIQQGSDPQIGGDKYTGLDAFGRVVDQNWGTNLSRVKYTYDNDSNIRMAANVTNPNFTEAFGFDNLNQLIFFGRGAPGAAPLSIQNAAKTLTWNMDGLGNWLQVTTTIGTTNPDGSYSSTQSNQNRTFNKQNQIVSMSGASTPVYDQNGNMRQDQNNVVQIFDAWNRVVKVQSSGSNPITTEYTYDALGRRCSISTKVSSVTTQTDLFLNQSGQVVEEHNSAGLSAQYVWSPVGGNFLTERDDQLTSQGGYLARRVYVLQDPRGTVTVLVMGASGAPSVVERYMYDPYGKVTILMANWTQFAASNNNTGQYSWQFFFQGGRRDSISGDLQIGQSTFNPDLGDWASPSGTGDPNAYRFGGNNPSGTPTMVQGVIDAWSLVFGNPMRAMETGNFAYGLPFGTPFARDYDGYVRAGVEPFWAFVASVGSNLPGFSSLISIREFRDGYSLRGEDLGRPLGSMDYCTRSVGIVMDLATLGMGVWGAFRRFVAPQSLLGGCFPADTPATTQEGLKPIQSIRANDLVWGYDFVTREWKLGRVVETYEHDYDGDLVAFTVADEVIEATSNHPVWVVEGEALDHRVRPEHVPATPAGLKTPGRWVDAGNLRVGDVLLLKPERRATVTKLSVRQARQKVYNFQVEGLHTYAVGTGQVLVHNKPVPSQIPGGQAGLGVWGRVTVPEAHLARGVTPQQIAARLPVWADGDPAHGALVVGDSVYLLRTSSRAGRPSYTAGVVPEELIGEFGFTEQNYTHIEASAAAVLRRLEMQGVDVSKAYVVVNRDYICTIGGQGCAGIPGGATTPNLNRMLPPGSSLTVYPTTAGSGTNVIAQPRVRTFIGG